MRVLIAEDDLTLRSGLMQVLAAAGHAVRGIGDGLQADTLLATEAFDLVVLDLGLPGLEGLDVLARLRGRRDGDNARVPVLILSARGTLAARVRGLDEGADDYLSKPFDLPEFEARVRALLRRGQPARHRLGLLEWDWDARAGSLDGQPVHLSRNETVLLESLLHKVGRTQSKAVLATLIGDEGVAVENKVEVYIHRLRKKLAGAEVEIVNVRGLGYVLREQGAAGEPR